MGREDPPTIGLYAPLPCDAVNRRRKPWKSLDTKKALGHAQARVCEAGTDLLKGSNIMRTPIKHRDITVLLVSDNESDIHEVRVHLEKTMGLSCHIRHCQDLAQTVSMFRENTSEIDIVLLGLDLVASGLPREIFRQVGHIVGNIPIIVFTERDDHELALLVIEEGAVDNVTRGQFSTDPYKLRDAIEFSMARDKISKEAGVQNAASLNRLGKRGASDLKDLRMHGASDLKEALRDAAAVLKGVRAENAAQIKEKDDIIHWMGGGYSVAKVS